MIFKSRSGKIMQKEMKRRRKMKKSVLMLLVLAMTLLRVSVANAQERFDGGDVYRDAENLNKKLRVSVYMDAEDQAEDEAIIMFGIKKKFVKGQTFGYVFVVDSVGETATYKLREKNRCSKRVPFGLWTSKENFKRMTNEKIEWVIIADDWYQLTPEHQAYIMKWSNVYYDRYYEI